MSNDGSGSLFANQIRSLESKIAEARLVIDRCSKLIEQMRATEDSADLLSNEFHDLIASGETDDAPDHGGGGSSVGGKTARELIVNFFVNNRNCPSTVAEIQKAIGVTRGAVSAVVYAKENAVCEAVKVADEWRKHWHLIKTEYQKHSEK